MGYSSKDLYVFRLSSNGAFSIRDAYDLFRSCAPKVARSRDLWRYYLPPAKSFLGELYTTKSQLMTREGGVFRDHKGTALASFAAPLGVLYVLKLKHGGSIYLWFIPYLRSSYCKAEAKEYHGRCGLCGKNVFVSCTKYKFMVALRLQQQQWWDSYPSSCNDAMMMLVLLGCLPSRDAMVHYLMYFSSIFKEKT
ncbi:conserved hypothetical protein [Ricinus communis]|uniref:Uncharacterized protein n=1 Tax=Ricinus communis TaxID=3988 RepID=B9SYE0_RICCO|nr:conserved hypothetical protein [Ricinus communis]